MREKLLDVHTRRPGEPLRAYHARLRYNVRACSIAVGKTTYQRDRLLAERDRLREALLCVVAALTQNATFPADVECAVTAARAALAKGEK